MAHSDTQVEWLRANHATVTGRPFVHFRCPITLRDEPAPLQAGHILNRAMKEAARYAVVQRKDVDGHFGATIEPDLIRWLNVVLLSKRELLEKGRGLTVTLDDGRTYDLIPARSKVKGNRWPKIQLFEDDGRTVAGEAFVKTDVANLAGKTGLYINQRFGVSEGATTGAWIKAAYLALFRRWGYRYVATEAGQYVRRALVQFFESGSGREDAHYFFDRFRGCSHFLIGEQVPHFQNTIEHGTALLHRAEGVTFALSCMFRVNRLLHTVTLPFQESGIAWFRALTRYDRILKNPSMPQQIVPAVLEEDALRVSPDSIGIKFAQDVERYRDMVVRQMLGNSGESS